MSRRAVQKIIPERFKADDKTWIWIAHAAALYEIPFPSLAAWYAGMYRCRWLARTLTLPRDNPERVAKGKHPRRYVPEDEVAEIAAARKSNALPQRSEADDAVHELEAVRISGRTREQLRRGHRHGCRELAGRKLWRELRQAAQADGRVRLRPHYKRTEMEELEALTVRGTPPRPGDDPEIKGWLSGQQAEDKYDIPEGSLRDAAERGVLLRKKNPAPGKWCPGNELWYYREAGEKSLKRYAEARSRPRELERATTFLRALMDKGPALRSAIHDDAGRQDIAPKTLRLAKGALKIISTQPGYQAPAWWHYAADAGKVPTPPPPPRPKQEAALEAVQQALRGGAATLAEVCAEWTPSGVSKGTMFLAWREVQEAAGGGTGTALAPAGAAEPRPRDEAQQGTARRRRPIGGMACDQDADALALADQDDACRIERAREAQRVAHPGLDACTDHLGHLPDIAASLREIAEHGKSSTSVNPPVRADSKTDSKKISGLALPENPDVLALARKINNQQGPKQSRTAIALDFTDGDEARAQTLLRELRRFPHLLD